MAALVAIAAFVLGLVLLVLLLPFHARASGSIHEAGLAGAARLDWAWGFLSVHIGARRPTLRILGVPVARLGGARGRRREPAAEKPRKEREERAVGPRRVRALVRERGPLLRMAARLARALHLRLRMAGRVGTGDPADTALLGAVARALEELPGVQLALELEWVEEALDIDAECEARIWLAELLAVAGLLVLAREHRAALRAVIS